MSGMYGIAVCISLFAIGNLDDSKVATDTSTEDKLAINEIKQLGAVVAKMTNPDLRSADKKVRYVIISKDWKGDDDGLKYVEQITKIRMLLLVGSVKISDERLKELSEAFPQIEVVRRKTDAMLGITIPPRDISDVTGVHIHKVQAKSPALKAGLLNGDIITTFDNTPVKNWDQFLELMDTKKAGDELRILINRNDTAMEFKVTLDSWMNFIEERE